MGCQTKSNDVHPILFKGNIWDTQGTTKCIKLKLSGNVD